MDEASFMRGPGSLPPVSHVSPFGMSTALPDERHSKGPSYGSTVETSPASRQRLPKWA